MIKVLNKYKRSSGDVSEHDIVVGIMRDTIIGNPFKLEEYPRWKSLKLYREWLWRKINDKNSNVLEHLHRLARVAITNDLYLVCCCKPLPCHGDIVKSALEWLIDDMSQKIFDKKS